MALVTLSGLKDYLGIETTTEDGFLNAVIPGVEAALKRLIGFEIEAQNSLTEYYAGNNSNFLRLRETPVRSVTSVFVDPSGAWGQYAGGFAASTQLTAGLDYYLRMDGPLGLTSASGTLVRLGNRVWPGKVVNEVGLLTNYKVAGEGNIKVVYNSGFETIPADIVLAVYQICAQIRLARQTGMNIQSESFEDYSYSLGTPDTDLMKIGTVSQVVATYRRMKFS